jgi:hypothetical protein
VTIATGADADEVLIQNNTVIQSFVDIRTGGGADDITIQNFTMIAGEVGVFSGGDGDSILIQNDVMIQSDVTVDAGSGANMVRFNNNAHLFGNLSVVALSGIDTVRFTGTGALFTVDGTTLVETGGEADIVDVLDSIFGDDFTLRTGDGDDDAEVCGNTFDANVLLDGQAGGADVLATDLTEGAMVDFEGFETVGACP